jgi:ADP-heptose:LPS heptosyltransferase
MFDNESSTSSYLVNLSNAALSLGIDKENRQIYNYVVPLRDKSTVHIVERIAQLLLPFGVEPVGSDLSLEYPLTNDEKENAGRLLQKDSSKKILAIILSGSSEEKYWGAGNITEFVGQFKSHYPHIEPLLFYQTDQSEKAIALSAHAGIRLAPLANEFNDFAAFLSQCDYLLTPDTSSVHLASAFKIPCVALYSYSGARFGMPWFPYKTEYRALVSEAAGGIKAICADEVIKAFEALIV